MISALLILDKNAEPLQYQGRTVIQCHRSQNCYGNVQVNCRCGIIVEDVLIKVFFWLYFVHSASFINFKI